MNSFTCFCALCIDFCIFVEDFITIVSCFCAFVVISCVFLKKFNYNYYYIDDFCVFGAGFWKFQIPMNSLMIFMQLALIYMQLTLVFEN